MLFDKTQVSMNQILNHDFLKQALEERLNKNTEETVNLKINNKKDIFNKAATLRSQSVAKQIKNFDYMQHMEEMRLLKAHHNTISFSEIEKHQFKNKKELSLPPIGYAPNAESNYADHSIKNLNRKGSTLDS